jgi:hypothetical protein
MLNTPLWQCPVCNFEAKHPSEICAHCGCNLLLLVKIKTEAQLSIIRAEEARGRLLGVPIPSKKTDKKSWFLKFKTFFTAESMIEEGSDL